MIKKLLWMVAMTSTCCFGAPTIEISNERYNSQNLLSSVDSLHYICAQPKLKSPEEIKTLLHKKAPHLSESVIQKVMDTLSCAAEMKVEHSNILTIIDYSLPSSQRRLWVFDLKTEKLLFYTYVSHGLKSGALVSNYFSNRHNSKASSLGVFKTDKIYHGRHGQSLRLDGLERGFNDNASGRAVVMHGGWYVDERFIKRYGRAGRSWGCPAVPLALTKSLIQTIQNQSLLIVYYPNDTWEEKSKFLNCRHLSPMNPQLQKTMPTAAPEETREPVLFARLLKKSSNESEPIVAMSVDNYERIFNSQAPLPRMLRRQVNNVEYIALSDSELQKIISQNLPNVDENTFNTIDFVVPIVKAIGGYYGTEMKVLDLGKIKDIKLELNSMDARYMVYFEKGTLLPLRTTNQFIRWLGL